MSMYLNIETTRHDGKPDNSALAIVVALNRAGFVLQDAAIQEQITGAPVLIARVTPPQILLVHGLPQMAKSLSCNLVLQEVLKEPDYPRAWLITPDDVTRIAYND